MNGRTTKLLKAFYGAFYYRDSEVFERRWKTIKKTWDSMPAPARKKAADRMRSMLERYAEAAKKAKKALPNYNAIMDASKLLAEKGLPTSDTLFVANKPEDLTQDNKTDGTDSCEHNPKG